MELTYLELLDDEGNVRQRVRVDRLPFALGRALENDLILDDPYVCPRHAEVRQEEGGPLVVHDLKSRNGLHDETLSERATVVTVTGNKVLRIGHTHFRIRRAGDPVPPAVRDDQAAAGRGDLFRSSWMRALYVVLGALVLGMTRYLNVWTRVSLEKAILPELLEHLMFLVFYGIFWALLGTLLIRRARFTYHMSILALSFVVGCTLAVALNVVVFNFPALTWAGPAMNLPILVLCLALHWHLRHASRMTSTHRTAVTAGLYLLACSITYARHLKSNHDFHPQPEINEVLLPGDCLLAPRLQVTDLPDRFQQLKERVDRSAAEKRAEQRPRGR